MNFLKKNYKIIVFLIGIILIFVGFGIIMFHKPKGKCEILTLKNDYYVVNSDFNNYINIPLYFSIKNNEFINVNEIVSVYLTNELNDEIIPLSILEINYLNEIKEEKNTYYQYDFKLSIDLTVESLSIYDSIYLSIDYKSGSNLKINIGSLILYNYKQNEEMYYTSLKGITFDYENKKILKCVLIKLNVLEEVKIVDIISMNNKIDISMIDSNVIDYVDETTTPVEKFVDNNYSVIGKNDLYNPIVVNNEDYLLLYLKYDNYVEIPCFGFIINYEKNGTLYSKVVNPFKFYKTNNLNDEIVKVIYDTNNY